MTRPLPRANARRYSANDFDKIESEQGMCARIAATWGVPEKFLPLAKNARDLDQFRLYPYKPINYYGGGSPVVHFELDAGGQFEKISEFITGPLLRQRVLINSYPYFFMGDEEEEAEDFICLNDEEKRKRRGGERFLYHLLCAIAGRVGQKGTPSRLVYNYLNFIPIAFEHEIEMSPSQLLGWGPLHEKVTALEINRTMQFFSNFADATQIVLMSVPEIFTCLDTYKVSPHHFHYMVNLDTGKPSVEKPQWARQKSSFFKKQKNTNVIKKNVEV